MVDERHRYLLLLTAALESSMGEDGSITLERLMYLLELRTSKEHDPQSRKLAGWLKSEVYVSGTTKGWYKVDRLDCRLSLMLDRETKRYRQAIRHASLGLYQW
jgi:hypothetical protein